MGLLVVVQLPSGATVAPVIGHVGARRLIVSIGGGVRREVGPRSWTLHTPALGLCCEARHGR